MEFNLELKNKIIEDETLRWVEIYKITNKINNKIYIGQAISHRKSCNKYYPKGIEGRFKEHIKESKPKTKYHCNALNNAIKTYGSDNFKVELICYSKTSDANQIETQEIKNYNSLVPNGYNINTSCNSLLPSNELREKISSGNIKTHLQKHLKKFEGFVFKDDELNFNKYLTPRFKCKEQIGWYLKLNDKIIEFKSAICDLNETKERAFMFLKLLKRESFKWQHDQIAGTPLEPSLPLANGNVSKELG